MYVILTSIVLCEVEDEEAAATIAIEADKTAVLALEQQLEMHGASRSDIEGKIMLLGTQVSRLPEGVSVG
jgi:hypothetical protein